MRHPSHFPLSSVGAVALLSGKMCPPPAVEPELELSVVMPCLNEARTVGADLPAGAAPA